MRGQDTKQSSMLALMSPESVVPSNETHESTTDPGAKLTGKGLGKEAKLSYMAPELRENRNGLLVDLRVSHAHGRAEREVALQMVEDALPGDRRITLGGDKN
jgi:hypothetical protein